jgi:hypothetical protein
VELACTVLMLLEMIIAILALGILNYFTNFWRFNNFIALLASIAYTIRILNNGKI